MNAHQAGECRQGSIPEPHRGQVSMSAENKPGTQSQWGELWRALSVQTHKMSLLQPGPRTGVRQVVLRAFTWSRGGLPSHPGRRAAAPSLGYSFDLGHCEPAKTACIYLLLRNDLLIASIRRSLNGLMAGLILFKGAPPLQGLPASDS